MKVVLYSGESEDNRDLDESLIALTRKSSPVLTYMPSTHKEPIIYFNAFKNHFSQYGVKSFLYFAPDRSYSKSYISAVYDSDVIFLGSGNTFQFLKNLKLRNLGDFLRRFSKRGGVLAGASAGAILLTPDITTAKVPTVDRDEDVPGLTNLNGLKLVPFGFSPHFSMSHYSELICYSRVSRFPILACDDGAGIVINGAKLKSWGPLHCFSQGKVRSVSTKGFSQNILSIFS